MKKIIMMTMFGLISCSSTQKDSKPKENDVNNQFCMESSEKLQKFKLESESKFTSFALSDTRDICLFLQPDKMNQVYFLNNCGLNLNYKQIDIDHVDWQGYINKYPELQIKDHFVRDESILLYKVYAVKMTPIEMFFFKDKQSKKEYAFSKEGFLNRFEKSIVEVFRLENNNCKIK